MRKIIGILFFLLLADLVLHASECYHYHTNTGYKIVLVKERLYLQITVVGPNGISIAHQQCIPILQVDNIEYNYFFRDKKRC